MLKPESKSITTKDFHQMLYPHPGFVVIQKDVGGEKIGRLYVPEGTRSSQMRWSPAGRIVRMSELRCHDEADQLLQEFYRVGDHVGFNATNPVDAPLPPYYRIQNDQEVNINNEVMDTTCMIHVADLLGFIVETPEEREALETRLAEINGNL